MEYKTRKMIFMGVCCLIPLVQCYPQERFHLSEANSLEPQPVPRSINSRSSNNLETTVKEVEGLIKSNPALPRLTRGEILDILENITSLDAAKAALLKTRDPKSIMVVMPYTPNSDEQNMEALYTKPPVTHIINSEPFTTTKMEPTSSTKHSRRRPPVTYSKSEENRTTSKPTSVPVRRRRPVVSTARPEVADNHIVTTYRPKMVPTTYRPRWEEPITLRSRLEDTPYSPSPRKSVRRKTTTKSPEVSTHHNHQYPKELKKFVPNEGIRIIDSPKLTPQNINDELLSDLNTEYDTKHEVFFADQTIKQSQKTTQSPIHLEDIRVPDQLKDLMHVMNLEQALNPTTTTPSSVEQNKIKEMLTAIGVFTTTSTTTTTPSAPNAENVAESLSPEMRELLMSFGLLPNKNPIPNPEEQSEYVPDKADVKPESYVGFKPLPEDGKGRNDMDALLASFGLGRSARREKAMKNQSGYNFDVVPDNFKSVIDDLGLAGVNREPKKINTNQVEKTLEKVGEKQHVFNPDTQYASEDELKKLDKLIGMIKQLEKLNGTATDDDLKKIDFDSLKDLVASFNNSTDSLVPLDEVADGPDPNDFDSGLIKNEVKRQKEPVNGSTVSGNITSASSGTTEEAKNPSIADLESSFGGQAEVTQPPPVSATTPSKKSGFYYLVDWNTFLDIDDTKGRRVNLRFQPTIGDPKRFYSVKVP